MQALKALKHFGKISLPDISAVDHARRKHFGDGQPVDHLRQFVDAAHAIDMHPGYGQLHCYQQILAQWPEIAGEHQPHAGSVQMVIGALKSGAPVGA